MPHALVLMKAHIITFGCRSNQCDSRWIAESLFKVGYEMVEDAAQADVLIVNTCTVTAEGERQGRQAIRRARRDNPNTIVIATGCAVQAEPASFLSMPEIDYVADLQTRSKISEFVQGLGLRVSPTLLSATGETGYCGFFSNPSDDAVYEHARVPLKIQDGCNNACAYCIVHKVRGPSRSMPPEDVFRHLEALGKAGVREVVFTGIHLGGWGRDLDPARNLESLIRRAVMRRLVERIRISSIDPAELSGELLDLLAAGEGLCPHVHLPLQSADDEILNAMGRKYKVHDAAVRIRLLKQAVPHAAVGLDIIVGFPGETDKHFERGIRHLREIPFDYIHVFPFSSRPGTPAAQMEGQLDADTIRQRCSRLHKMSAQRRREFWEKSLGSIRSVIIEYKTGDERWFGHTDNYIPILLPPGPNKPGDLVAVGLYELEDSGVRGDIIR